MSYTLRGRLESRLAALLPVLLEKMRGGDAFFDYIGSYASANGRWRGELVNHEHTPSQGERPVFGGYEVGIGFSGTYTEEGAVAEAVALAGKRSIRFSAVLKKLADG